MKLVDLIQSLSILKLIILYQVGKSGLGNHLIKSTLEEYKNIKQVRHNTKILFMLNGKAACLLS